MESKGSEGWEGGECQLHYSSCPEEKKKKKKSICNSGPIDLRLRRCGSPLRFDQVSRSQMREPQQREPSAVGGLNEAKCFSSENYTTFSLNKPKVEQQQRGGLQWPWGWARCSMLSPLCPQPLLQTSPGHPKALFIPKKLLAEICQGVCVAVGMRSALHWVRGIWEVQGTFVLRGRYPTTCHGKESSPGQNPLVIFRQIIFFLEKRGVC